MYPMILSVRKSMSLVTINIPASTATYDVQSLAVEEVGGGGGVEVRGGFLSGSRAVGCLVVFQGPPTSPDIFRVLQRTQSEDSVSTSVHLPPSTYTVYGYDCGGEWTTQHHACCGTGQQSSIYECLL